MVVEELAARDEADAMSCGRRPVSLVRGTTRPLISAGRWKVRPDGAGCEIDGNTCGTTMVGHDGHRGWIYYLAVDSRCRDEGIGSMLMSAAEEWLKLLGVVRFN